MKWNKEFIGGKNEQRQRNAKGNVRNFQTKSIEQ